MDGFSLIIGGTLGMLAGWAISLASMKQRDANNKLQKATKATQEVTKKKDEARNNKDSSLADTIQGFMLYALGFGLLFFLGVILISSFG